MKKAELSINLIVIAAIALLILVIISVLIFGAGGDIVSGTSCEGIGGFCEFPDARCGEFGNYVEHHTAHCPSEMPTCCVPLGE